jgi:hypothetical protein
MNIPAKIPGLPYKFTFQFDLGSDFTLIYENSVKAVFADHPEMSIVTKNIGSLTNPDNQKFIAGFTVNFDSISARCNNCFVRSDYGETLPVSGPGDTTIFHIGSVGADMFQNKVVIIDYPNQRFAICDTVPRAYNTAFTDIELDESGRIILPMTIKGKKYRISFDNGSSLFPIITLAKNISSFSTGPDTDSLEISSWGKRHYVTGRHITDTFELAGHKFSNVKVYANHAGLGIDSKTDGMTGNALFWNNTIVIDFKHKKFGMR